MSVLFKFAEEIIQSKPADLIFQLLAKFSSTIFGCRRRTGPGTRLVMQEWLMDIRDQCLRVKVPFFFKQWGGVQKKRAGRILEGRTWDEMPVNMNMVKA